MRRGHRTSIVFTVMLAVAAVLVACSAGSLEGTVSIEPTGGPALPAKEAYAIARAAADEWQPNAFLIRLETGDFSGDETQTGPGAIYYDFVATKSIGPLRLYAKLMLTIDAYRGTVVRALEFFWTPMSKGQAFEHVQMDAVTVDSTEALQIAEAAGGRAYRERERLVVAEMSLMPTLEGEEPVWSVVYFKYGEQGWRLAVYIDATTGEILRIYDYGKQSQAPLCAPTVTG